MDALRKKLGTLGKKPMAVTVGRHQVEQLDLIAEGT